MCSKIHNLGRMRLIFVALALFLSTFTGTAETPLIGAQIWIESGQTPAQIDGWFRQLSEAHMPVARLFLMWPDLEPKRDVWDFALYDEAFRAAERYHVRIESYELQGDIDGKK
jgi:beta-galactosidase